MESSRCQEAQTIRQQLIAAYIQLQKAEMYPHQIRERYYAYSHLEQINQQMVQHREGCATCRQFEAVSRANRLAVRRGQATEGSRITQ